VLLKIKNAKNKYMEVNGFLPDGVSLDYFSGIDLLLESTRLKKPSSVQKIKMREITDLLNDGDRKKIIKFIENTTVFGMVISIPDIIGDRRIVCTTQQ